MGETVRAEALYSGYVQGVGFRFTARNVASRYEVAGFVRNLPNGKVQVVLEGAKGEIEAFFSELAGEMGGYIQNADVKWQTATGEFKGFGIRF